LAYAESPSATTPYNPLKSLVVGLVGKPMPEPYVFCVRRGVAIWASTLSGQRAENRISRNDGQAHRDLLEPPLILASDVINVAAEEVRNPASERPSTIAWTYRVRNRGSISHANFILAI